MQMSQIGLSTLMVLAGIGIPVMAALNSGAAVKMGSPYAAVTLLCGVALATSALLLLSTGVPDKAQFAWPSASQMLAGVLFVFYIAAITYSAPRIGLGNAVFLVLFGQLLCAALMDHFSLLGVPHYPITGKRLLGLSFIAVGVFLARSDALATNG